MGADLLAVARENKPRGRRRETPGLPVHAGPAVAGLSGKRGQGHPATGRTSPPTVLSSHIAITHHPPNPAEPIHSSPRVAHRTHLPYRRETRNNVTFVCEEDGHKWTSSERLRRH